MIYKANLVYKVRLCSFQQTFSGTFENAVY